MIKIWTILKHWNQINRSLFKNPATSIIQTNFLRENNKHVGENLQPKQFSTDAIDVWCNI